MAGLGIGPDEFEVFAVEDAEARSAALEARLAPRLQVLGAALVGGLSRVAGVPLHVHLGKVQRRKGVPPGELHVAFSASEKAYKTVPHLLLAVTARDLHARVAARASADRGGALQRALQREALNLSRKGKPFRKLRSYEGWNHDELPEIAPAHSAAFWTEQAEQMATAGVDLGVAWPAAEARSLAAGDVLGAFRDLASLFKLLLNAR
ncbi:MAG: DUF1054 family protein [Deltaproteobacteria bacterium]|nr:DUF1054 family protein [Deltaproteobacteria bacterium]